MNNTKIEDNYAFLEDMVKNSSDHQDDGRIQELLSDDKELQFSGAIRLILGTISPEEFKERGMPEFAKNILSENDLYVQEGHSSYTLSIPEFITDLSSLEYVWIEWGDIEELIVRAKIKELDFTFYNYKKLRKVVLPEGIEKIGRGVFEDCSKLEEIYLPDSIRYIGEGAFANCESLKIHKLPDSLEFLGGGALSGCNQLTELVFPPHPVYVEDQAYAYGKGLKKVVISDVLYSDGCIIHEDDTVETLIYKGNSVIRSLFFLGCTKLKHVKLGEETRIISEGAFLDCSALEEITLPAGTRVIESCAFEGCVKLKEIVIPDGMLKIADDAFKGCINTKFIYKGKAYSYAELPELTAALI